MKHRADYEVGGLDTEISVDGAKAKDGIEQIIKGLKKLEKEYKAVGNVDMAKQIKAFQQEFYKATKGGENLNKLIKQMQTLLKSNGKDTFAKQFEETLKNVNRELDKTKKKVKDVQVDPKKSFNKDLINYERQLKSSGKYNAAKRVSDYRAGLKYGEIDLDKLSKQAEQIYGNGAGTKLKDVVNGAMSNAISPELEAKLAEMERQEAEAQKKKTQELKEQKEIIKQTEEFKKSLKHSGDEEGAKQLTETINAMKSSVGSDTLKIVPDDVVTNANRLVDTIQKSNVLLEEDKNKMIESVRLSAEKATNAEAERMAQEQYNAELNEELRLVEELSEDEGSSKEQTKEKKSIFQEIVEIVKQIKEGYKGTVVEIANAKDKTKDLKEETDNTKTKWNEVGESIKKAVDFLKGFGMIAIIRKGVMGIARAWKTLVNYADKVGEVSGGFLQTQHMFNTIMGDSVDKATEFQKRMNEAFGTNMADTMKYQSYFMQMATSMGIANKEAYTLSKGLTMLGEDLAGFYGISEDSAMQKLRLGLSGQTKSLRSLGLDVTNQTMSPVAQELGITKSVKNMSQGEKVALRYITIMKQTAQMQGELAKKNFQLGDSENTLAARIETPANQLRVLKQQVKELGISIGNIFLPILQKVLPYVNGFVMALKAVADMIAIFLGFNSSLKDGFGTTGIDLSEDLGLDDAVSQAKELNKQLGFDELNVLSQNDSGSGAGFGIDPALLNALEAYDNGMENIRMKAIDIRDRILEWLGFSKEFNEETGEWEWNFGSEENQQALQKLIDKVKILGGLLVGLTMLKFTGSVIDAISNVKNLISVVSGLGKLGTVTLGVTLAITGIMLEGKGIKSAIENGLDGFNFGEILTGALGIVGGGGLLGKALGTVTIAGSTIGGSLLLGAIGAVVAGIPMFVTGIYDAIMRGLNWLNGLLIPAGSTLAGAGAGAIIGSLGGPIGTGIGALIGLAVGLLTDFGIWLGQHWEEVKTNVVNFFTNIGDWVHTFFTETIPNAWAAFKQWLSELPYKIGYWLGERAAEIYIFFTKTLPDTWNAFWQWIGQKLTELKNAIVNWWNGVCEWARTVPEKLRIFFTETIPQKFQELIDYLKGLPEKFIELGKNIVNGILDGIKNAWEGLKNAWNNFCDGLVQGFKDKFGIASPSKVFKQLGEYITDGLEEGLTEDDTIFDGLQFLGSESVEEMKNAWGDVADWFNHNVIAPLSKMFNMLGEVAIEVFNNIDNMLDNLTQRLELSSAKLSSVSSASHVGNNDTITKLTSIEKNVIRIDEKIVSISNSRSTMLNRMSSNLLAAIAGVKKACENIRINVTNNYYSSGGGGSSSSGTSSSSKSSSSSSSSKSSSLLGTVTSVIKSVGKVLGFANGGMPESGSLFYSNENGAPELVGQIGNRTAVANNQQIVEAVSAGVANAVARTLGNQKERPIDVHVEVDSREIARANNQGQRKLGHTITGGAFAKG